jgi:mRNA interferase YafQ
MRTLHPSTQYKKDIKRYRNQPKKINKLMEVLRMLQNEQVIPESYSPHFLTGDYAGCLECHIEGDFLLIWFDHETDQIDLVRLGSHAEVFGKGAKK